jgi:phosphoketolase
MVCTDSLVGLASLAVSPGTFLQPHLPALPYSHVNAKVPGCIHEGGELGYVLSVSFGAVMDRPDLVVACVVGDGEAETGPTAT